MNVSKQCRIKSIGYRFKSNSDTASAMKDIANAAKNILKIHHIFFVYQILGIF